VVDSEGDAAADFFKRKIVVKKVAILKAEYEGMAEGDRQLFRDP